MIMALSFPDSRMPSPASESRNLRPPPEGDRCWADVTRSSTRIGWETDEFGRHACHDSRVIYDVIVFPISLHNVYAR